MMCTSLLFLTFSCCLVDGQEWMAFVPKDGSFEARFPQIPNERATRTGALWQYAEKDRVYNVAKAAVPGGSQPSASQIEAALDAVRDNIIKRVQAKLISEKTLKHRNTAAREFIFALPEEKGLLRIRCFVAQGQVWEIKVGGPKDYIQSKDADAFLDGLKVK